MKLTAIFLFAICMQVAARTEGQTVTLKVKNAPIDEVFLAIQKQTGYNVMVDEALVAQAGKVTLNVKDAPINVVLDLCLKNEALTYSIANNRIIIKQRENAVFQPVENLSSPPPPPIKIRVVDEQGQPLSGASVTNTKTKNTVVTDSKGEVSLIANSGDVLSITFVGFDKYSIAIKDDNSFLNIVLKQSASPLDQVVVRAYDQTSRRLNTGNIQTVTAKQIDNQPVTNPLIALQGQVPGLIINQSSGYANSGVTVQIQGPNSLLNGNMPFYVIDGVPYPSQNLPGIATAVLGLSNNGLGSELNNARIAQNGNPLSFINPQDIESISILKDADATAIYGSQAANGAIIITTKKGKVGPGKISLNLQQGVAQDKRFLKVMNREQYMKMRNEAYFVADGLTTSSRQYGAAYDLNGTWDTTRETDWQKTLLGGTAKYTNLQGSLSGGTAQDQYLVSANYNRQTLIFPTDLADQKGSFLLDFNHSSANNCFKAHTSVTYLLDNNRLPSGASLVSAAYFLPPVAPALYKADGSLNWPRDASGTYTFSNPLGDLQRKALNKTRNLVGNLNVSYQIINNLILSSSFGYTNTQQDEITTLPTTIYPAEFASLIKPSSRFSNGNQNSWLIEPRLNYTKTISKGKLDAFLGASYRRSSMNWQSLSAINYSSDLLLEDIKSAGTLRDANTSISQYRYGAFFGHVGYNWNEKYIVNFNARRDGSSRFGSNNLFHAFWSAAGAWIFSEEKLIKENLSWLSFGKLNLSYGSVGSDGIGDYLFLNQYGASGTVYQGLPGLAGGIVNPNIQWEASRKLNMGLSMGFMKDRILVEANYYRNRCSNQLLSYVLPTMTGAGGYLTNFPATVQNMGWEFILNAKPVQSRNFYWNTNFNISMNRNKLVSFPTLATSSYANNFIVGQPIDITRRYRSAGVNAQTGLYQFYKADGSITSNPSMPDDAILYSFLPKFTGGWINQFQYKAFSLEALFQFAKQTKTNNLLIGTGYNAGDMNNQPAALDYWTSSHTAATAQKLTTGVNNDVFSQWLTANGSNLVNVDGSYIRLKNVSLSYQMPTSWVKKVRMTDFRILLSAQNLLTFTKYKGLDPETGNSGLPPLRVLTVGIRADF